MGAIDLPASAVETGMPLEWGIERTMTDFEATMWRLEADPRLRSPVAAVEVLDRTPDWDRFLAAHEWATRVLPRARMRVVDTPLHLGNPVWAVDPNFDLSFHVRRQHLPSPATFDQALQVCQAVVSEPFDPARPPWQALLVEGMQGGPAVYLIKTHHSLTDGLGGMQMLALLHSRRRRHNPHKWQCEPPAGEPIGPWGALSEQVTRGARAAPTRLVATALRAPRTLALATHPASAAAAIRWLRSLNHLLAPPTCPPSPLLRGRSLSYRFSVLETTVDALKRAGKAGGGSLNDAYVAALLGGFRRYHEALGCPIGQVPMAMPVSMRTGGNPMGGNRFSGARFAAPVDIEDPAERIAAIREIILSVRHEPALDALQMLAPALSRIPTPLFTDWYASQSTRLDLQASNFRGIPVPVYVAGARIERMFPFGPLPGCAVMVVLASHCGVCCIGINADPAAVTEPDLFLHCMQAGLDEVLRLGGGTAPRSLTAWRKAWEESS
ncbi:wax ester/triacylglycerol synthase domain-containing protein [Streptomyces silvisoli]|uniref:diacylglycerol O-acyltransferase n=1 Tax=Streptomyces silvisoli TaxID=3034235 RepID=A0ABT5ZS28_9ACTN|nr:wax ester/triacylglycerol synthase domain-containing protein [Streptomyces silvisoli]MDF3292635.1 wax ester/triacylglycerol synthase family O-acyltransferase [Streptomyces silvisoli]